MWFMAGRTGSFQAADTSQRYNVDRESGNAAFGTLGGVRCADARVCWQGVAARARMQGRRGSGRCQVVQRTLCIVLGKKLVRDSLGSQCTASSSLGVMKRSHE